MEVFSMRRLRLELPSRQFFFYVPVKTNLPYQHIEPNDLTKHTSMFHTKSNRNFN